MKIPFFPKKTVMSLSLCMLAVGCATQEQTAVAECAVGGGGLGLVMCKLLNRSDGECAAIVSMGTVISAGACHIYATRLAERRKQLAGRENDLDAQLQYVRGLNEDGQRLNADLRERVAVAARRSRELTSQVGRAGQAAKEDEKRRLDTDIKSGNEQVALQRNALKEVKTYQAKRVSASADLDAEIVKQERLLADAQQQMATLASLKERI